MINFLSEKKKGGALVWLILIAVVCFLMILVILLVVLVVKFGIIDRQNSPATDPNDTPEMEENSNTDETPEQDPEIVSLVNGQLFYVKDNNIFSYDSATGETNEWTGYALNPESTPAYDADGVQIPTLNVGGLAVIDQTKVGFIKCAIIIGDFGCGINVLNVETGAITEKALAGADMYVEAVGFYTEDIFTYLASSTDLWQLTSYNDGVSTLLEDIAIINGYGRGGFEEDSNKIRYSPNGQFLLQIATSSPKDGTDFQVYVHNLNTLEIATIAEATHPEWLNNNVIIFRRYASVNLGGLYTYNINTGVSEEIDPSIGKNTFTPQILGDEVLYTNAIDKEIWGYNMDTGISELILVNAVSGIWLTPDKVVYYATSECVGMCEGMSSYNIDSLNIYDRALGTTTVLPEGVNEIYGFAAKYFL